MITSEDCVIGEGPDGVLAAGRLVPLPSESEAQLGGRIPGAHTAPAQGGGEGGRMHVSKPQHSGTACKGTNNMAPPSLSVV